MGRVLRIVAVVVAIAVVVFAPQISAAILSALSISSAVAVAVLAAALTVGAGLALKSLSMGAPSTKGQVGPPSVFRQSIAESFIVYGKRRVGGLLVFFHPKKVAKVHYRYFVIACAGHRCKGIVSWMLNDEVVTVDGSNKVTSGTYANAAWLWFQRGLASETANATFVSECGGKWTTDHKGNGIAAIYAKFEMTDQVVGAGMPNITAIIEGRDEILDTRDATEKYTNNGALVLYDWLAIPREEGGFGAYPDEIPDDAYISAQANVCDETVNTAPRYALNGVIVTGAPPGEIRDVLVVNVAGSYTYSGGKHLMRVGYWVPVSETLSEDDLAGAIQISPFLPSDAAANEVQGNYISPNDNYQAAPFTTQTTDPAPSDIRQTDLDLAFTTNKDQADRVARIMLNRAQAEKTVTWPANITGLKTKALDVVQFGTTRYSLSNYAFVITGWGLSPEWNVVLTGREENEDIYTEPTPVSPPSIPTIDQAETVLLDRDLVGVISRSYTIPTNILEVTDDGTDATVTIIEHTRVYPGYGSVLVATDTISGLTSSTIYGVYYDDATLADTTPTITATDDLEVAQIGAEIGRHSLGTILTPAAGSGATYTGGGTYPPGSTVGGEIPSA